LGGIFTKKTKQKKLICFHYLEIKIMQQVHNEELVPGKDYYLECFTYDEHHLLIPNNPVYKMVATFQKLESREPSPDSYKFPHFTNFRKVNLKNDKNEGYDVYLHTVWKFYEIKKDIIQTDMEKRALAIVLKNIIGDKYFQIEIL